MNRLIPCKAIVLPVFLVIKVQISQAKEDKFNFKVTPIQEIMLEYKIADKYTLGPVFDFSLCKKYQYQGLNEGDSRTFSTVDLGIRGDYYFAEEAYSDGWYIAQQVSYLSGEPESHYYLRRKYDEKVRCVTGGLLVGYGWFSKTLNLKLGAGVRYYYGKGRDYDYGDSAYKKTDISEFYPEVDATIGWTF